LLEDNMNSSNTVDSLRTLLKEVDNNIELFINIIAQRLDREGKLSIDDSCACSCLLQICIITTQDEENSDLKHNVCVSTNTETIEQGIIKDSFGFNCDSITVLSLYSSVMNSIANVLEREEGRDKRLK